MKTPMQELNGWNGYNQKGQAVYDAIFEQEKSEALKRDCMGVRLLPLRA